ncbi:MAG: electron transfer flavoprotein subunit alpha/FixB family protein [Planctomycetes bacterium]|nr:electron transfer flavoprotein subunit alpha/FixB family protein [Planctomycetota bacterium]
MGNDILAFAEQRGGTFKKAAHEVVNEGKRLAARTGGRCIAVVLGQGVLAGAGRLGAYGASAAWVAEGPAYATYHGETYLAAMAAAVARAEPRAILLAASANGKDLAPRLAAHLDAPLASDLTGIEWTNGRLVVRRPVYAGKATARVDMGTGRAVLSLRPNVFTAEAPNGASAAVEPLAVTPLGGVAARTRILGVEPAPRGKVDLTEADFIVSGGRGLKGPENFHVIEGLAEVMGATVGASRAVVDAGWRPHSEQVGQTGKTVSPTLYLACGISGAIQHLAGMSSSKWIVAINKDPEAPIFKVADYGIVGDLFEVVPALATALRAARSGG